MANRINGLLVPYRSMIDPTIWYRYEPLSDEEMKDHNEHVARVNTPEEHIQHVHDLAERVKVIWYGTEKIDDPTDIKDTLLESNGAVLGNEVISAMIQRAVVLDREAPFLAPPSTGA